MNYAKELRNVFIVTVILISPFFLQAQVNTKQGRGELKRAVSEPRITKGAPYSPAKPLDQTPNIDIKPQYIPSRWLGFWWWCLLSRQCSGCVG